LVLKENSKIFIDEKTFIRKIFISKGVWRDEVISTEFRCRILEKEKGLHPSCDRFSYWFRKYLAI